MRNSCEAKIQSKKEEKEGLEAKQKENDEQIIGQDASKRNIEVSRPTVILKRNRWWILYSYQVSTPGSANHWNDNSKRVLYHSSGSR